MARSASPSEKLSLRSVSALSQYSPGMDALNCMTPLPSPLTSCDSPGPWDQFGVFSRQSSLTRSVPSHSGPRTSVLASSNFDVAYTTQNQQNFYQNICSQPPLPPPAPPAPPPPSSPRLTQPQLSFNGTSQIHHYESTLPIPIHRNLSRNGHERSPSLPVFDNPTRICREKYLAQRRRTLSSADSSPYLNSSATSLSSLSSIDTSLDPDEKSSTMIRKQKLECFQAKSIKDNISKRLRGLRLLGQGTFSKVILATSENIPEEVDHVYDESVIVDEESVTLNPRKYLAVKIIEHGAAGTDSKERVESGLKRELDILRTVHHPCLVRLKAFSIEPTRALLVLNFCAGGDLFDVASDYTFHLEPPLIQRMFAEIVSAVRYLHHNGIVHRDVKLESMIQCLHS